MTSAPSAEALVSSLTGTPNPAYVSLIFVGAALLPFLLLALTSFLKISVVFSILRNALGAQQVPSGAICSLLALVLSLHIMAPIAQESYQNFQSSSDSQKPTEKSASLPILIERISSAALPWESFLRNNSAERERVYFATLGTKEAAVFDVQRENIVSLLPAFLLTELREAFQIGFLLFLPFLVVDLVVTNLLVGLGMTMLTPTSVSLPLKLLLFYLADGWFLLSKSLVEGYLR